MAEENAKEEEYKVLVEEEREIEKRSEAVLLEMREWNKHAREGWVGERRRK